MSTRCQVKVWINEDSFAEGLCKWWTKRKLGLRWYTKMSINIDYYSKDFIKTCKEKLNKDNTIAIYCQSGSRSKKSAKLLVKENFTVINLKGGIDNWKKYNKKTVK